MHPEPAHENNDLPLTSFLLQNGSEVDFEALLRAIDSPADGARVVLNVTTGAVERIGEDDRTAQHVPIDPVLPHVRQRWMVDFVDFLRGEDAVLHDRLRTLVREECSEQEFEDAVRAYGDGWIGAWAQHRHDALYTIGCERLRMLRAFGIVVRERFNPMDDDCPLCHMLADGDDAARGVPM